MDKYKAENLFSTQYMYYKQNLNFNKKNTGQKKTLGLFFLNLGILKSTASLDKSNLEKIRTEFLDKHTGCHNHWSFPPK